MTIGERIKELRIAKGWSQEKLAQESQLNRNSIYYYETGKSMPRMPQLKRLAKAFGGTVEELFTIVEKQEIIPNRLVVTTTNNPNSDDIAITFDAADEEAKNIMMEIISKATAMEEADLKRVLEYTELLENNQKKKDGE